MKRLLCGAILFVSLVVGITPKLEAQAASPTPISPDNVGDLTLLASIPQAGKYQITDLQWSPDGRTIAMAGQEGAQTFDLSQLSDKPSAIFGKTIDTGCVAFSPDRTIIATCSNVSSAVWLWDRHTGKKLASLDNGKSTSLGFARFSPNGRLLAVNSGNGDALYIWGVDGGSDAIDPSNAIQIGLLGRLDETGHVIDMAFSPDGTSLVSISYDTLWIWNLASMKLQSSQPSEDQFGGLAYSPDGQWLALGGYSSAIKGGYVRLVNLADASITRELKPSGTLDEVLDLNFSPDGKLLVSGQLNGTFIIWDVNKGVALRTIKAASRITYRVAFNRDNTLLATLNFDDGPQIWGIAKSLPLIPKPVLEIGAQALVNSLLNLRAAAGTKAERILQLKAHTVVTIIDGPQDIDGTTWWKVRNGNGVEGWVVQTIGEQQALTPDY